MKINDFSKGYLCAVSNLVSMYGDTTEAYEVFRCNAMTEAEMRKIGVDEFDIEKLKPLIKEHERKRMLAEPTRTTTG